MLRRVSRHWSDVMVESPVLQRAMFLAPQPELPFEWTLKDDSYDVPYLYTKGQSRSASRFYVLKSSRFNPLLFERRPDAVTGGAEEA